MPIRSRHTILFPLLALVLISLACSLPGLGQETPTATATRRPARTDTPIAPARPTPTPQPLPPGLVESDPLPNAEISPDGTITLYFNQPMDRASIESAFSGPPGDFDWADDSTLIYTPDDVLTPASEISLSVEAGAQAANGMELGEPIELAYRAVGYLRLSQALPENGSSAIDPASAVVAAFNRPVVPLGADPGSLPPAFSLEPAADGHGEWLNTSTYIFYPGPALAGGEEYTVQVLPDLIGADGSALETPAAWSFTTATPRLSAIEPAEDARNVRLDADLILTFNQPMDATSVAANIRLEDAEGVTVSGDLSWNEDFTEATFNPGGLLSRGRQYILFLEEDSQSGGGTALGSAQEIPFRTVEELSVAGSDPADGGTKEVFSGVSVTFSAPIRRQNILQFISFEPQVPGLDAFVDEEGTNVWLNGNFSPETAYRLTISPNLADAWNGRLGEDFTLDFNTRPLDPNLVVTYGTDVLFLTPDESSIIVQVTNMRNLAGSLGRVPVGDFITMLTPGSYDFRQTYHPEVEQTFSQALELPRNESTPVEVPLSLNGNPLGPGFYILRFDLGVDNIFPGPYLLVVSNVNTALKMSAVDALVWGVDLRDGSPATEVPVTIYSESGAEIASGDTDGDGVFQAEFPPRQDVYSTAFAILGEPGEVTFSAALTNWSQGLSGGDFGYSIDYSPPHLEAYLYTDRPIYRPGQTVFFKAIARQAYNGRYEIPDQASLSVALSSDFGEEVTTFRLPLSTFGTAHGSYDLPEELPPGQYRLTSEEAGFSSVAFQVAEYRKPDIDLSVSFPVEEVMAGETLEATVEARYFFDAPAGDVPLTWALFREVAGFNLPGYEVGKWDNRWLSPYPFLFAPSFGEQVNQGEGRTDPDGRLEIDLGTSTGDTRFRYTLEVTATDESGLPVSARAEAFANPADFYTGVRPDSWLARAGEETGFDVLIVDWDRQPAGSQTLRAEFSKVEWELVETSVAGLPRFPSYEPRYTLQGSTDFSTGEDGAARLAFTPAEAGTYQLQVAGIEQGNERALTQVLLWVSGSGEAAWPDLANQRLRLTADQDSYQPGETAQVFIPNPLGDGVQALVTIERGVVFSHEIVAVDGSGISLSIPLGDNEAPNVYLSVTLLKVGGEGGPDFRQGFLNLPVEPITQTLDVSLTSQPQRAGPGEPVVFDLLVTDASGNPVEGEFSLSVVDLAVLALADPNVQDILPAFYGEQSLAVNTSLGLAAWTGRNLLAPEGLGGGGGDGALPIQVREEFPDTAYWDAEFTTDSNGQASVSVTLPDSLTTWQIDVRGLSVDTRVGQDQDQVVASKDLLVRPVTPRFLVLGDHTLLAAVVHNNTTRDLQVDVSLEASGFTLDDPDQAVQEVTVEASGRARVEWWGTAEDIEGVDPIFSALADDPSGNRLEDAARPALGNLPVLRYVAPETFGTSGTLEDGGDRLELVSLPRSFDPGGGSLDVEMAPTLGAALEAALNELEDTPYAGTEQIVSRFLPNLELYRVVQEFQVDNQSLRSRLDRTLADSIAELAARQNEDGGFSWWQGGPSDPYVTAYTLFGMVRAEEAGADVKREVIRAAVDYLRAALPTVEMLEETWQFDRLAFETFVLAEVGETGLGSAASLFEVRDRLNPWARALLALTFEDLASGDERTLSLYSDLEAGASRSASGAHWETDLGENTGWQNMSSTIQGTATVLYALAQHDPASPLVADAMRYLMAHRDAANGGWASTYETAWTLMAAAEVLRGTGELGAEFEFSAEVNGAPLVSGVAEGLDPAGAGPAMSPVSASIPIGDLYPDSPNAVLISRSSGPGRLYYTAHLTVDRPVEEVAPLDKGIGVSRTYYPAPGAPGDPFPRDGACPESDCPGIGEAQPGDLVTVRLTLTVPETMYYLILEDFIPAGAEVLNTSLKTSASVATPVYDPRRPIDDGWGWWYFRQPQVYDDHVTWAADSLPAGTYELTYQLAMLQPGEYRVLPARAWQLYFPEVQGNSAGEIFKIGD